MISGVSIYEILTVTSILFFSVASLLRYRTWPGPTGDRSTRQWLARVVIGPLASECSRMKEFSPVSRTSLGSVGLTIGTSAVGFEVYHVSSMPDFGPHSPGIPVPLQSVSRGTVCHARAKRSISSWPDTETLRFAQE